MNSSPERSFDGVICFGGLDWWYHNRGHYDLQMMRELSRVTPVLYVNSLGMRTPRLGEGRMFFVRAVRKLRSFGRGLRVIRPNFAVLSPVSVPFLRGRSFAKSLTSHMVRRGARRMGIKKPLIWVNCPPAAELLDRIPHSRLVYQRTDRFEAFPDIDRTEILSYDKRLKRGDVTLYCTKSLLEEERRTCRNAVYVDHGVDFERFAGAADEPEPADVASIVGPRVGFVGGLDPHTFDASLFCEVARQLPDHSFILVGKCSLPEDWCAAKNVHQLGQRPYEDVAAYMAACDILIMPWLQNDWVKACNPIKLKEYLAVGRPVVSTPFDELAQYEHLVTVANSATDFTAAILQALAAPSSPSDLRARVRNETWTAKADLVLKILDGLPQPEPSFADDHPVYAR